MALTGQRRHRVHEDITAKDDPLSGQMHHDVGFGMSHAQIEYADLSLPLIKKRCQARISPISVRVLTFGGFQEFGEILA
jgi:hypothetical protein